VCSFQVIQIWGRCTEQADSQAAIVPVQALTQICKARQILGYSFVFAYYMFGNDMFQGEITVDQNRTNQDLFEDQQAQLEHEVGDAAFGSL
jgi:Ariadne domain